LRYLITDDPRIRLPRELDVEPDSLSGDDSKDVERYIETLVVVDEKMCAFHGEDAAKQFTLAACNIVSVKVPATVSNIQCM
jgi:hypothetical protein